MTKQEQFEAWCKTEGITTAKHEVDGTYINSKAFYAWKAWQTATAQAVPKGWVVLPVDLVGTRMHLARKYNENRVHAHLSNTIFPKKSQEAE